MWRQILELFEQILNGFKKKDKTIEDINVEDENELEVTTSFEEEIEKIEETVETVLTDIAKTNGIEIDLLRSFIQVESSGRNYGKDGRLIIRFERHIFRKYIRSQEKVSEFEKSKIGLRHRNQNDEYMSLEAAKPFNYDGAYKSISMGSAQIMGFHSSRLGFQDPKSMFMSFSNSEVNVMKAFGKFISLTPSLVKALRIKDYHKIAYYYNGSGYKKYKDSKGRTYADKIKLAYENLNKRSV